MIREILFAEKDTETFNENHLRDNFLKLVRKFAKQRYAIEAIFNSELGWYHGFSSLHFAGLFL